MRIYYNSRNGKTAKLDTDRKTITHDSGKTKTYNSNTAAAADIRKHGYKLICIK